MGQHIPVTNSKSKYKQGYYIPKYPEKCILTESSLDKKGNFYRSAWERRFMFWVDHNPTILKWSSEPFSIPYWSEVKKAQALSKGKAYNGSKYFIDFYLKNDKNEEFLVEVKPLAETKPPKMPKKKTQKAMAGYMMKMATYEINVEKWKAAEQFCLQKGLYFKIITEVELKF